MSTDKVSQHGQSKEMELLMPSLRLFSGPPSFVIRPSMPADADRLADFAVARRAHYELFSPATGGGCPNETSAIFNGMLGE